MNIFEYFQFFGEIIFGCIIANLITLLIIAAFIYFFYRQNEDTINDTVEKLKTEVNEITTTVDNVNNKVDEAVKMVDEIKNTIDELKKKLEKLPF